MRPLTCEKFWTTNEEANSNNFRMADLSMPIRFGFLPYKHDLNFSAGKILAVPEFDERLKLLKRNVNEDGYLYPRTQKNVITDSRGTRTVPKTKRPARLFSLA